MRRIDRLRNGRPEERALQDLASWVPFAGLNPMGMNPVHTTWGKLTTEPIPNNFEGYVRNIYKRDGVVFGLIAARAALFKQARFQWQRMENGTPGDLFGTADLALLERPWPNGTTSDLLARMEQDASLAGQFYGVRRETPSGPRIRRLRPSLVYVVTSSPSDLPDDPDAEPFAYLYWPNGQPGQGEPLVFAPSEVIHYAPTPDPEANWRGMSWLTPVLREIESDMGATEHKARFFENAATPNLAVSLDKALAKKDALEFIEAMRDNEGARNAYKTLWLAGGADVKVVGADLKQLDFKVTQGAGETVLPLRRRCRRSSPVCPKGSGPPPIATTGRLAATSLTSSPARRGPTLLLLLSRSWHRRTAPDSGTTTSTFRSCKRTSATKRRSSPPMRTRFAPSPTAATNPSR